MCKRDNNSDFERAKNCDHPSCKSAYTESSLDDKRHQVRDLGECDCMGEVELEYDWIMTLAKMWDNPNEDFDFNLEK